MKRVGLRVRRIATVVGIAALAVLILWVWLVPPIIERMIITQFETAGLPKPTLRVRGLSLSHLEMTNLAAGEEGRLVPQDLNDEPASALLDRIRTERAAKTKTGRATRRRRGKSRGRKARRSS